MPHQPPEAQLGVELHSAAEWIRQQASPGWQ